MKAALIYLAAVLAAQLTATLLIPLPFIGSAALGTFIFGITFTQRDRMHRMGRRFVYKIILLAGVLSLVLLGAVGLFLGDWLIAASRALTPAGTFQEWLVTGFDYLKQSNLRVFVASFTAIIIAESLDTEIYHKVLHHKWFWRVCRSNSISVPTDTLLFNSIAFLGVLPAPVLVAMTLGEIFIKYAVSLLYALLGQDPQTQQGAKWGQKYTSEQPEVDLHH